MLIIDAHLDLSMNALQWNRNLLLSTYTIRTLEQTVPGKGRAQGTVAFPEMRRGRIALSVATLIARSTGRLILIFMHRPKPMAWHTGNWPIIAPWNNKGTFALLPM